MKVALVHDYLINNRGGERVFSEIAEMYPRADVFTLLFDPSLYANLLKSHRVFSSPLQKLLFSKKWDKALFPLYPLAVGGFDLGKYDLVLSSSSGWVHGVTTSATTCHICYYHTPLRYLWHFNEEFLTRFPHLVRWPVRHVLSMLRRWDLSASKRVDYAIANSQEVRGRIMKYYGRDSVVIHPPVRIDDFNVSNDHGDFFLVVSALVPHKKVDIAVEAFSQLGLPLLVVGEGGSRRKLEQMAGTNVRFLGNLSDEEVKNLYSHCRAFIFPTADDFGITPVEAQASGRPVIAYRAGGAMETVDEGVSGVFFGEQTAESLVKAVEQFSNLYFDPRQIRKRAERFDIKTFREKFTSFTESCVEDFNSRRGNERAGRPNSASALNQSNSTVFRN